MIIRLSRQIAWAVVGLAGLPLFGVTAAAAGSGMNNQPWSGESFDRATMAVVMRQADTGASASSSSLNAGTTLVCGGGGTSSTATANSSCIIINNGTAQISAGQTSDGAQTAHSNTTTLTAADSNALSSALSGLVPQGK